MGNVRLLFRAVLGLAVALLIVLGLLVWGLHSLSDVATRVDSNQRNNAQVLCAFRGDLQRRVDSGIAFLRTHPRGILGIPPATLRVSIDNQQSTLNSLRALVC